MKTTTAEKIAVMKAAMDGKKIQYRNHDYEQLIWRDTISEPLWDFRTTEYRVKPVEPLRCWVVVSNRPSYASDPFTAVWADKGNALDTSHDTERVVEFVEVVK